MVCDVIDECRCYAYDYERDKTKAILRGATRSIRFPLSIGLLFRWMSWTENGCGTQGAIPDY